MDNKKIGSFIAELRKTKNITQKELAEKLNVTDKAVSKWERGLGYPEITTIPLLAKYLDVSTNEIMLGQRIETNNQCKTTDNTSSIISNTAQYVEHSNKQKNYKTKKTSLAVLSVAFLIAMFVCLLCNFIINKKFSWSLYVVGSEIVAWIITAPFLLIKKQCFLCSLTGLTIIILPFLKLVEYLCPVKNWAIPFALPIVVISILSLWVSMILFVYTKILRLYLISFEIFLFGVIVNLSINAFVSNYLNSPKNNISTPIIAISCGFLAVIFLIMAILKSKETGKHMHN